MSSWSRCEECGAPCKQCRPLSTTLKSWTPDVGWKWWKWTFGLWRDTDNATAFGIDIGPLEIVWRYEGYIP